MPEDDVKKSPGAASIEALDQTMEAPGGAPAPQAASPGVGGPQRKRSMPPVGAGFDQTIAGAVTQAESVAVPTSGPRAVTSSSQTSTVGQELRGASIERFGRVERDRFEILGELARGGLGRVLTARDPRTGRVLALKEVLYPTPELIHRFAREAIVTANLQHPAIVPVYEVGRWAGGEPFYAMKLVKGRTLDSLIAEAKAPAARVQLLPHVIAVADALAYAHGEHVIHRDLKPANVLVGDYGETVVIDWGLARNLTVDDDLAQLPVASTIPPSIDAVGGETVLGAVVGTPAYMPPEQAIGERVDERADVYAIGAILYHVLGGTRPFAEAKSVEELLERVAHGAPKPLAELAPDAPPELLAVVGKAMARAREDRYATAAGLAQDLRRFQAGQLVGAHRYTSWQLVRRWIAKNRTLVTTASIALVALIAVGAIGVHRIAAERDEANRQRAAAETAHAQAVARFAQSLEELARQAANSGGEDRALAFAAGAIAARPDEAATPLLRVVAGEARGAYAGLVALVPPDASTSGAADIAPDGLALYVAEEDGTLVAYDLPSGRKRWSKPHAARVVAVSPDGRTLVMWTPDGAIVVRRAIDGADIDAAQGVTVPPGGENDFNAGWSDDGAHFYLSANGHVWLGAPIHEAQAHSAAVFAASFSPNGALLATAGAEGRVLVADTSGATTADLADGPASLNALVWLDDDHLVTGDAKGVARVWQVSTHTVLRRLQQQGDIYGVVAGPAGPHRWLATFGASTTATLWDLDTGEARAQLPGHHLSIDAAATDGRWLVTTDEGGNAFRWDPLTGVRVQAIPPVGQAISIQARGPLLVLSGEGPTRVLRFGAPDLAGPAADALRTYERHTSRIRDLQLAAGLVWTASNDGTALALDPQTGDVRFTLGSGGFTEAPVLAPGPTTPATLNPHGLRSIRFSPDGALAALGNEDGSIAIYDAHTGAAKATWRGHTGRARRVAFAADGKTAWSAGGDGTVRRWDVATGAQLASADLGESVWDVLPFPAGDPIAVQTDSNKVIYLRASDLSRLPFEDKNGARGLLFAGDQLVLATPTQLVLADAAGHEAARANQIGIFSLALSDALIAAGDSHDNISLYDRKTLALVRRWHMAQLELPSDLAFSPDGALLASTSMNHLRVWDVATGRMLAERELSGMLAQVRWLPDGKTLVAVGGGHAVSFWDLRGGDPATLPAFAKCVAPWTLADTSLVAAPLETCAVSSAQ